MYQCVNGNTSSQTVTALLSVLTFSVSMAALNVNVLISTLNVTQTISTQPVTVLLPILDLSLLVTTLSVKVSIVTVTLSVKPLTYHSSTSVAHRFHQRTLHQRNLIRTLRTVCPDEPESVYTGRAGSRTPDLLTFVL